MPIRQLAQQAFGGRRVAVSLNKDIKHHPVLVERASQPVLDPRDRNHVLIHVPLVGGRRQPVADLVGERLAELERSLAPVDPRRGSTVTDDDAARGQ